MNNFDNLAETSELYSKQSNEKNNEVISIIDVLTTKRLFIIAIVYNVLMFASGSFVIK